MEQKDRLLPNVAQNQCEELFCLHKEKTNCFGFILNLKVMSKMKTIDLYIKSL